VDLTKPAFVRGAPVIGQEQSSQDDLEVFNSFWTTNSSHVAALLVVVVAAAAVVFLLLVIVAGPIQKPKASSFQSGSV